MHLAKNSNLSIELNLSKVPIPKINKIDKKIILDSALYGGDDYELLFLVTRLMKVLQKNYLLKWI